ncbi:MAG: hypothetical protein MJA27_14705 [Pseudanabaenales cyanobacterium]|nr:hypothetical protein [Pseudanabaenales cyanobacterium]
MMFQKFFPFLKELSLGAGARSEIRSPPSDLDAVPDVHLGGLAGVGQYSGALQWSRQRRFFNAYGPSESTVCATLAECTEITRRLPIGRPIANTQIYILDRHLQPFRWGSRESYILVVWDWPRVI